MNDRYNLLFDMRIYTSWLKMPRDLYVGNRDPLVNFDINMKARDQCSPCVEMEKYIGSYYCRFEGWKATLRLFAVSVSLTAHQS